MKTDSLNSSLWCLRSFLVLLLIPLILMTLVACDSGDPDTEEGGVVGTGIILKGTASEVGAFANNTVQIKALDGARSSALLDDQSGRYTTDSVTGSGPWVLRTTLGPLQYRYAIAFDEQSTNINSYTDLIVRFWFSQERRVVDDEFDADGEYTSLPSAQQYSQLADSLFSSTSLLFQAYGVTGVQLLSSSFDGNGIGIDGFLKANPVLIDDTLISTLLTDPVSNTQSVTRTGLTLNSDLSQADVSPPDTPGSVRALGSAANEIIVIWEPSIDNVAVDGYQVYRDGVLVRATPFPVFTDSELQIGTQYRYSVVAIDASGNQSDRSSEILGSTLAAPDMQAPPTPTSLTLLNADRDRVRLIWGQSDIADVVAFNIYRAVGSATPVLLGKVTSTLFTDVRVVGGENYCYQVSALDSSENESSLSEVLCVETSTQPGDSPITDVSVPPLAGLTIRDTENLDCSSELGVSNVLTNTTLEARCYTVSEDLILPDFVNLTLVPGTTLKFSAGVKLLVGQHSSLTSTGTAENPVIMTGVQSRRGYWGGIEFNRSNNSANLIRHTVLQYTGGGEPNAAIELVSSEGLNGRIRIENSLIRFSSNYGLTMMGNGALVDGFSGNLITGNNRPGAFQYDVLESIGYGNDFSGNDDDTIDVSRNSYRKDILVPNLGVRLRSNGITITNASFTIEAGVELRFLGGAGVFVDGDVRVLGNVEAPVLLSGFNEFPGAWQGIIITDSDASKFEHAIIEFGGEPVSATLGANLTIDNTQVSLSQVEIRDSSSYGVILNGDESGINQFEQVTITDNLIPIQMPIEASSGLTSSVNLTGNSIDRLELSGSLLSGVDAVWPNIGIPYYLSGSYTIDLGSLALMPGVNVVAGPETELFVTRFAALQMIGTDADPIFIRGELSEPGSWGGLIFASNDSRNVLEHVVLTDAGGMSESSIDQARRGSIRMQCSSDFPASLSITNTDILDGDSWGIYLDEFGCDLSLGAAVRYAGHRLGTINVE